MPFGVDSAKEQRLPDRIHAGDPAADQSLGRHRERRRRMLCIHPDDHLAPRLAPFGVAPNALANAAQTQPRRLRPSESFKRSPLADFADAGPGRSSS